ncbi:MAG TPA: hypothetical protein VEX68_22000 [Bryobacteraceae bacterium]|nr:hypothetical protein [Bryobacteraceae bacterium]
MKSILTVGWLLATVNAEQLRITEYYTGKVSLQATETVVVSLNRIFRESGIEIEWVVGVPGASEASLIIYEPYRIGYELELACRARRDIALDIRPAGAPGMRKQVLGMAQPWARTGLNVRVYEDHIRRVAVREGRLYTTVLAHAIAHEIGHVLLRSATHTNSGLMSEVWTGREFDWLEKGALLFTPGDSRKMRETLSGRACSSLELTPTSRR